MAMEQIMQMEDPHEALKAIMAGSKYLSLTEIFEVVERYLQLHQIDLDKMAFYPNGERVVTLEMVQDALREEESVLE